MSELSLECCACQRVVWATSKNDDGSMSGRWECDTCERLFSPDSSIKLIAVCAARVRELEVLRHQSAKDFDTLAERITYLEEVATQAKKVLMTCDSFQTNIEREGLRSALVAAVKGKP